MSGHGGGAGHGGDGHGGRGGRNDGRGGKDVDDVAHQKGVNKIGRRRRNVRTSDCQSYPSWYEPADGPPGSAC